MTAKVLSPLMWSFQKQSSCTCNRRQTALHLSSKTLSKFHLRPERTFPDQAGACQLHNPPQINLVINLPTD